MPNSNKRCTVYKMYVGNLYILLLSLISVDAPVIQGPSKVIYRPNEPSIELTCIRNTTVGSTGWHVNGSDPPYLIAIIRNGGLLVMLLMRPMIS